MNTPNGYDPAWVTAINQALEGRQANDVRINDINDAIWNMYLGPMLDAIEAGDFKDIVEKGDKGTAHIRVEMNNGTLTVWHGDTGEKLFQRKVRKGYWTGVLWPILRAGLADKWVNPKLQAAIDEAGDALSGDSNDAEHDALVSLMQALGQILPKETE